MSFGKIGDWFEMRFLRVSVAPLSEALFSEAAQKYCQYSCWHPQEIHGLKCVCSAFCKAVPLH